MMSLTIRPCADSDVEPLVALWDATGLTRPWNDPRADIALCRASMDSELFVGEVGAEIVASVMVGHDGHRGWLYYLAVRPDRSRSGFGTAMVHRAEEWILDRGVPKVQLMIRPENVDARPFYLRIGYEDNSCRIMQRWLRGGPKSAP